MFVHLLDYTHGDEHAVVLPQRAQYTEVADTADDGSSHDQAVGGVMGFEGVDDGAILGLKHPEYAKRLDESPAGLGVNQPNTHTSMWLL